MTYKLKKIVINDKVGWCIMKIEIKKIQKHQVAFILEKGSYEKIPKTLDEIVGWLMTKNVEIQMPIYGLYYNNPIDVSENQLQWEMGASFVGDLEEEGRIKIKTVPDHLVVSTIFKAHLMRPVQFMELYWNLPPVMVIKLQGQFLKVI